MYDTRRCGKLKFSTLHKITPHMSKLPHKGLIFVENLHFVENYVERLLKSWKNRWKSGKKCDLYFLNYSFTSISISISFSISISIYGHFSILNYGICRVFCKSGGLKKEKHHHIFKWKRVNIKARQRGFARGFYIISVSPSVICCKANIKDYKSGMFLIK